MLPSASAPAIRPDGIVDCKVLFYWEVCLDRVQGTTEMSTSKAQSQSQREVAESGGEGAGGEGVSFVGVRGRRSLSVQMRAVGA